MLRQLHLQYTGPAEEMSMAPIAPRFNLITGDNGLGKSFLLDVAWWALTRTWSDWQVMPNDPNGLIGFEFDGEKSTVGDTTRWDALSQSWKRKPGRPPNPGLVLYARVDGSFSVWDPARNYRLYKRPDGSSFESPPAYKFTSDEVLYGLHRAGPEGSRERQQVLCNGLISDWTLWQLSQSKNFDLLKKLMSMLGPDLEEPLEPGAPVHAIPGDDRAFPTVRMRYRLEVPIIHAPAGVQRMSKLAYLLAWALSAHERECKSIGIPLSRQVIVLIDEPETHLHPRWQRTVLPSLHNAIRGWHADAAPDVQLLVATHSPLVLASMEPIFDAEKDALWVLDLVGEKVELARDTWQRRGDASRWLTSDVFDLKTAGSLEAERAMTEALALLRAEHPAAEDVRRVSAALASALGETDRFWVRWSAFAATHGVDT